MKSPMMVGSETPDACILAMRSRAGREKLHSSIEHVATVSGQPHWHASLAPTRRTSIWPPEVCAVPVWISAATLSAAARRALFLDRDMFGGDPDHFGSGVLHFDLAGYERNERSEHEHQRPSPD